MRTDAADHPLTPAAAMASRCRLPQPRLCLSHIRYARSVAAALVIVSPVVGF
jgi:hypothetical protein